MSSMLQFAIYCTSSRSIWLATDNHNVKHEHIILWDCSYSIHVVFGHVLSGQQLIREIEDLTVTEQSRPLTEVRIDNCGELIPQLKKGMNIHYNFLPDLVLATQNRKTINV